MSETVARAERRNEILSLVGAVFLGVILIIAAVGKVLDPIVFVEQIRNEGLDIVFSANNVALIALALEAGLGMALVLGIRSFWVLVPTGAMVAFFMFLTGRTYWLVLTGQKEDSFNCGCFGVFLQRTASEAFWQDTLLLLPAMVLAFLSGKALKKSPDLWKVVLSALAAVFIVVYTVGVVGLPATGGEEYIVSEEGEERLFTSSGQFVVLINGSPAEASRVFETEVSLEFLLMSDKIDTPLLLNVLRSSVSRIPASVVRGNPEGGSVTIPAELESIEAGNFQVGSEGLSFEIDGVKVLLKSP